MWSLPKGKEFLPRTSMNNLEIMHKDEKNVKAKMRLLVAIHRKEGKSVDRIAEMTRQKKRTVHEWLWKFHKRGVEAKDSIKQSGRPSALTAKQMKELVRTLGKGPPYNPSGLWTTKEVRKFIGKKYGISFVPQHVWRIMTALGFSLQSPRKKHYKSASRDEIEAFKKRLEEKRGITERKVLLWPQKMKRHLD